MSRVLTNGFDPANPQKKRWPANVDALMQRIFQKYPEAVRFDPCDCGIVAAVIERASVNTAYHYVIDDPDLKQFALAFIRGNGLPYSRDDSPTSVLILGERA